MDRISDNITLKYNLLFSLTWIFSLMFYPVWIEPTTSQARLSIYIIVTVWTVINIILFHRFLLNNNIQPLPSKSFSITPDKYSVTLASLLLINILLHIYPILGFPLIIGGDEAAHAQGGISTISRLLWMKKLDLHTYYGYIRIIAWISLILPIVLFSIKKFRNFLGRSLAGPGSKPLILFYAILFSLSLMVFFLTKDISFNLMMMRYPPLGKVINTFSISLFGINEFSVRMPQLLFTTFGSIIIYKICEENLSRKIGLISGCFYAFAPVVFHFSALGELICGTVFFSIVITYFYLKYVKTDNVGFLFISIYLVSLGFLYKRVIIIMLAVLCISIIFLKNKKINFPFLIKLGYFSMVPILPYLVLGKIYPNNPFGLNLSNWLSTDPALGYFLLLLSQLSYPLAILAAISGSYVLFSKDIPRPLVIVLFAGFIIYYVFYTSISIHGAGPYIHGLNRYSMILYPCVSIITGLFIDKIVRTLKWKHSFTVVFSALIIYLVLLSTILQAPPLNPRFVTYKNIELRYFPVDKAIKWVKDNVKDREKILILRLAPTTFYRDKYGIERKKIIDSWYNIERYSTPDKLRAFYKETKVSYIMFSYGYSEKTEIMNYLKEYRGDEFREVAKFNLGGNYIYIYKTNSTI